MVASLDTVVKQLEDSGIIAPGKLKEFIPPKATPKDAEELIRELFRQNHLTKFQAQQVAQGKAKALILGGYVLLDRIGAGGMGQVFKAEHRRMKRVVAIKTLPASTMKDAAAIARFQREVEAAAKLRHPNIVAADDADEANGTHFLVMEYVEGSDLSVLVKKHGTLPVNKALQYILQAARGLEFAHKKGVVHRDIKPGNLLVDGEGNVKILDMGLARIESHGEASTQAELTGTGAVMGTVDYMAPEQAISTKGVDSRADIYSLGCTLYYLLAGKCTYDGETLMAKLLAHREAPIPELPATLARSASEGSGIGIGGQKSEVGEDVQALFARMVAKRPDDRYQTMTEVIADIERILAGQSAAVSLAFPASSTDTGLTRFFQQMPGPGNKTAKVSATEKTRALVPAAPVPVTPQPARKKTNPKLIVYGLIAGGFLSLLGIPLVLYLALNGAGDTPPKATGSKGIPPKGTTPEIVSPAAVLPMDHFALRFDQRGHKLEAPNVGLDVSSPFTIEAYVTPGDLPGTADDGQFLRIDNEFGLRIDDKCWCFYTTHNHAQANVLLVPNRRVHLAGVRTRSKRLLFVDGRLAGEMSEPLNVRRDPSRPLRPLLLELPVGDFTLLVDQLRISQGERYSENFTPPPTFSAETGTLALYTFSEGTGDILTDSSGKGHDGKITGATWVNVDGSPIAASASPSFPQPATVQFGPSVDLLKTLKTDAQGVYRSGGGVGKPGGTPVFFEGAPVPEEYTLELDLEREVNSGHTEIALVCGGKSCSAVLATSADSTATTPRYSGLTLLDGLAASDPQNPTRREGDSLRGGQASKVVCDVRKNSIRVTSDGQTVIDWTGDTSRLSPHENLARSVANRGGQWLGLVQWTGTLIIHRAILRPVTINPSPQSPIASPANAVYLDDLPETSWKDGHLALGKHNLEYNGWKFTWRGKEPAHSLTMHPLPGKTAVVTYRLDGKYDAFAAVVGLGDGIKDRAESPLTFRVLGDGRELWKSPLMQKLTDEAACSVSVRGVRELALEVGCSGGNFKAHGVWFEPRLTRASAPMSPQSPATSPSTTRWPFDPPDGKQYAWSEPENLGTTVNTSAIEMAWGVSPDERQLYFQRNKAPYVAVRSADGAAFSSMNSLAELPGGEHGSVSANGLEVAYVANRSGGKGEIWLASRLASNLPFSTPQLAPPPVNGNWQSDRPVLSPDALSLLTLTTRDASASAEIWLFTRSALDQPFATGENIGSPPNTPGWDIPYYVSNDRCFVIASSQGDGEQGADRFVRYFTRAKATDPFGPGVELDIPLGEAARTVNSGFRLAASGRALYFESSRFAGGQGKFDIWVTRRVKKP